MPLNGPDLSLILIELVGDLLGFMLAIRLYVLSSYGFINKLHPIVFVFPIPHITLFEIGS